MGSKYPDPDPLPIWWDDANRAQQVRYIKKGNVPLAFQVRKCEACLAPFKPKPKGGRQRTCSDECAKAYNQHLHRNFKAIETRKRRVKKILKDPSERMFRSLRSLAWKAMRSQLSDCRCTENIGCTRDEFVDKMLNHDNAVKHGFTLDNYGTEWHIDHIRPLASFDLKDPEQAKAAFHYSNCQPLSASENMKKNSYYGGKRHYHKGA